MQGYAILYWRNRKATFIRDIRLVGWLDGWILWHIPLCNLFNVDSCLYIFLKYTICKLRVKMQLGVMAMKAYFDSPKTPGLETHYLMVIIKTFIWKGFLPSAEMNSADLTAPVDRASWYKRKYWFLSKCHMRLNFMMAYLISFNIKNKVGDPKDPFSIATAPWCWGGCYTIRWIAPLYPWSLPYDDEC